MMNEGGKVKNSWDWVIRKIGSYDFDNGFNKKKNQKHHQIAGTP